MMESCIEWDGPKNDWGYGKVSINHRSFYAHRVAYANANGLQIEDLKGLVVRHRCDNPACVNPNHLVIGSHDDNMKDMTERGRSQHGAKNYAAKLTEALVLELRRWHSAGESMSDLARKLGIDRMTVSRAIRGVTWKHLGSHMNMGQGNG